MSGNIDLFCQYFLVYRFHVFDITSIIKHDFFDKIIETQTKRVKDHEFFYCYYQNNFYFKSIFKQTFIKNQKNKNKNKEEVNKAIEIM